MGGFSEYFPLILSVKIKGLVGARMKNKREKIRERKCIEEDGDEASLIDQFGCKNEVLVVNFCCF